VPIGILWAPVLEYVAACWIVPHSVWDLYTVAANLLHSYKHAFVGVVLCGATVALLEKYSLTPEAVSLCRLQSEACGAHSEGRKFCALFCEMALPWSVAYSTTEFLLTCLLGLIIHIVSLVLYLRHRTSFATSSGLTCFSPGV
jgi:hypothetical protein